MPRPYSNVRSAAIDGRLHNPIYAKEQLKQLHDVLSQNASDIQQAITRDTAHRSSEVKVEYWLAMRCLAEVYSSLDAKKLLEDEYAIAAGRDAPHAREPVGIVVVEPTLHTFFHSLVSAVAPALAAGNCVVIQLEQSMLETPPLVLGLIGGALDPDIFHVSTTKVQPADLAHRHLRVQQNGSEELLANNLVSHPDHLVAAVVERDANIPAAARALVLARFALRSTSPYSPDIVFVNEWVKKEFLLAVTQACVQVLEDVGSSKNRRRKSFLEEVTKEGFVSVVSMGKGGVVLDIENRESFLLGRKLREPCLAIHAVTSVDDAIDMTKKLGRLSAAYVFTTPATAKYVCQFLDSEASFVNHIPPVLLFGPVSPIGKPTGASGARYRTSDFTLPRPQYITPTETSSRVSNVLLSASPRDLTALDREALAQLPSMKRPDNIGGIGFFNQGILTGGVLLLATVISCSGGVIYCASRWWSLGGPRLGWF
ncbi:uncharacterized protein DNG_04112 [Cephalotrichum gorgonifer]|uniref:Aldehyde dehydrogenase domain-containing protein n=1 Tax=Cephalotrichum gorgonifer TaxID=2041049 RepID=A0AAE8SU82_9PEZI|nr:uncharacterized protein DNG_04112 [Cephalotrichum gorgonifer]